ncbi:MAG: hypothetical protein WAN20_02085 [Pseudonocardiaceae bacterium]|jgi:hypothetical protein
MNDHPMSRRVFDRVVLPACLIAVEGHDLARVGTGADVAVVEVV